MPFTPYHLGGPILLLGISIWVFKGEMAIVGTRPLSQRAYQEYPDDIKEMRSKYKPGCVPPYVALLKQGMEPSIEAERQYRRLILIPSESSSPWAVREALSTPFHNIYAEGYPDEHSRRFTEEEILDYDARLGYYRRYSDPRYYKGVEYAINTGADIILTAWGVGPLSAEETRILEKAKTKGILVIASAGNMKKTMLHLVLEEKGKLIAENLLLFANSIVIQQQFRQSYHLLRLSSSPFCLPAESLTY